MTRHQSQTEIRRKVQIDFGSCDESHSSISSNEVQPGETMMAIIKKKIQREYNHKKLNMLLNQGVADQMQKQSNFKLKNKNSQAGRLLNSKTFKESNQWEIDMLPSWKLMQKKILKYQKKVINYTLYPISDSEILNKTPKRRTSSLREIFDESDSSITSIDEDDLILLIQGEHKNYFDAKFKFQELLQKQETDAKQQEKQEKSWFCNKKAKKENINTQESKQILKDLQSELKIKFILQKQDLKDQKHMLNCNQPVVCEQRPSVLKSFQSIFKSRNNRQSITSLSSSTLVKNQDSNELGKGSLQLDQQIQSDNIKKRTGKQLWAIARQLVYQQIRKKDLCFNMMEALRREKLRKKIKEKELNEQMQREKLLQMQQCQNLSEGDLIKDMNCFQVFEFKLFKYYQRLLVYPDNKRLRYFHLVVSLTLFLDFYLTGLIMGNYLFIIGQQESFVNHDSNYIYICLIQGIDIILNFFKGQYRMKAKDIFLNYIKGNFITDLIAFVPYSMIYRPMVFLRYIKLLKYNTYLGYFEDFVIELCKFMNYKQLQIFRSMFRLLFQLSMVSHLIASFWCLIGNYLLENETGWIYNNHLNGIQKLEFSQIYITSIYWVITTFTSIGYGDVYGHTRLEYLFILFVQMVGMCFFGYMMGTFQQLIQDLATDDLFVQEQDKLDQWLIKLNKIVKERTLDPLIFKGVQDYSQHCFKQTPYTIMENQLFSQLKPRLQRLILDQCFNQYYIQFKTIFEGCELDFQREIFMNVVYTFFHDENPNEDDEMSTTENQANENQDSSNNIEPDCDRSSYDHVWFNKPQKPIIIQSGKMSNKIYFIISGPVYLMDPDCFFEYGVLYNGSYFGEISLFFNEPNQFTYAYNPLQKLPHIQCLSIDSEVFMRICRKYPLSFEVLLQRAYQRKCQFMKYRAITNLTVIKGILNSERLFQNLTKDKTMQERNLIGEEYNVRKNLLQVLYHQYQLRVIAHKKKRLRDKLTNKLGSEVNSDNELDDTDEQYPPIQSMQNLGIGVILENSSDDDLVEKLKETLQKERKKSIMMSREMSIGHVQQFLQQNQNSKADNKSNGPSSQSSDSVNPSNSSEMSSSSSSEKSEQQNKNSDKGDSQSSSEIEIIHKNKIPQDSTHKNSNDSFDIDQSQEVLLKSNDLQSNEKQNKQRNVQTSHSQKQDLRIEGVSQNIKQTTQSKQVKLNVSFQKRENRHNVAPLKGQNNRSSMTPIKNSQNLTFKTNQSARQSVPKLVQNTKNKYPALLKDNFFDAKHDSQPSTLPKKKKNNHNKQGQKQKGVNLQQNVDFQGAPDGINFYQNSLQKSTNNIGKSSEMNLSSKQEDQSRQTDLKSIHADKSKMFLQSVQSRSQSAKRDRKSKQENKKQVATEGLSKTEEVTKKNKKKYQNEIQFEGGDSTNQNKTSGFLNRLKKFNPLIIAPAPPTVNKEETENDKEDFKTKKKRRQSVLLIQKELREIRSFESSMESKVNQKGLRTSYSVYIDDVDGKDTQQIESFDNVQKLETALQSQVKNSIIHYFQHRSIEKSSDEQLQKLFKKINVLIEEFLNYHNVNFYHNSEKAINFEFARYQALIDNGQFSKTFIPRPLQSVIDGRKDYLICKNQFKDTQKVQQADLMSFKKNYEYIISYKQYQEDKLFQILNTNHDFQQVKTAQGYIQNSMNQQLENNKKFKQIYDTEIARLQQDMDRLKTTVGSRVNRILELQKLIILQKTALRSKIN